jgi:hypothetical protein
MAVSIRGVAQAVIFVKDFNNQIIVENFQSPKKYFKIILIRF